MLGPVMIEPGADHVLILEAINRPARQVQQLTALGARLDIDGVPTELKAELACELPGRLRLRAGLPFSAAGSELDLGSDGEQFWMWVRREGVLYHGTERDLPGSRAEQLLPVSPSWLIEALGIVSVPPDHLLSGPVAIGAGQYELHTQVAGRPDLVRVLRVDRQRGFVIEQHIYRGSLAVASARSSQHQYDETYGVALPRKVEIFLPGAQLQFRLSVDGFLINQLAGDRRALWEMPNVPGRRESIAGGRSTVPGPTISRQSRVAGTPIDSDGAGWLAPGDAVSMPRRLPPAG